MSQNVEWYAHSQGHWRLYKLLLLKACREMQFQKKSTLLILSLWAAELQTWCKLFGIMPPSQNIRGQHGICVPFPINVMSVKTHIPGFCARSNCRCHILFCWYKNLNHSHYLGNEEPKLYEMWVHPPICVKEVAILYKEFLVHNDPRKLLSLCKLSFKILIIRTKTIRRE